jgi:protein-L-isoaspartate(D-aspartate) O-methyltransferase
MATTDKGSLAYLTLRPIEPEPADTGGTGRPHDIGVIGHGPGGDELAHRVADEIAAWDRGPRGRAVEFAIQPTNTRPRLDGQFLINTPHNQLAVSWL